VGAGGANIAQRALERLRLEKRIAAGGAAAKIDSFCTGFSGVHAGAPGACPPCDVDRIACRTSGRRASPACDSSGDATVNPSTIQRAWSTPLAQPQRPLTR